MDDELYSFALKTTLTEIHNTCPDIKNSFIFKEDGQILTGDENTPEKTIAKTIDSFDDILEKAKAIGGIDNMTIEGNKGRVSVSCMNDLYLVTVTSTKADKNYVNTVTHVLIPTVLKLLERIAPTPLKNTKPTPKLETEPPIPMVDEDEPTSDQQKEPTLDESSQPPKTEGEAGPPLPEPPIRQFMVETIGGLLVPDDTVRVDSDTLAQWQELLDGREIEEIGIETFNGKTARCKVKPIKKSKQEGRGIIQIPGKIQTLLETKKGELVRVKPVIE